MWLKFFALDDQYWRNSKTPATTQVHPNIHAMSAIMGGSSDQVIEVNSFIKKDSFKKKIKAWKTGNSEAQSGETRCYRCNEPDHYISNCFKSDAEIQILVDEGEVEALIPLKEVIKRKVKYMMSKANGDDGQGNRGGRGGRGGRGDQSSTSETADVAATPVVPATVLAAKEPPFKKVKKGGAGKVMIHPNSDQDD
jgi:hypothetical protein